MPQGNLSKRLYEPSSVVMISGGIDSVAVLKRLLEETDEKIYAHHVHIKNNEGMHNIKRYKAEALALRKIIPYMKKNFRDFHYSESTIDTRQICNLRKGVFDEEDEDDIYGDYEAGAVTAEAEPDVVVEVERDTLQLLLDAFKVKN